MDSKLISIEQCPAQSGVFVSCRGRELAIFHLTDPSRFVVTDNSCPHAGGNLSGGTVREHVVCCPMHAWEFDLETGRCVGSGSVMINRYSCRVVGTELWADLSRPLPVDS